MQEASIAAPAARKSRFPKAVPYIIGNEAAERFSYYGLRSILVTFLVAQFYNPLHITALTQTAEAHANESTHFFVALSYFMPLVGGIMADWFFGKYKVILWISMVYCLGNVFTSSFTTSLPWFSVGLILIAIGAGGIKGCVSANVGEQFDKTNQDLLSKVYGWFYFSINAGSMVSTVLIPWVYANYGAPLAFGIPGALMALATIIFFSGRKKYVRVPPAGKLFQTNSFSFNGRIRRTEYAISMFISGAVYVAIKNILNNNQTHNQWALIACLIASIITLWFSLAQGAKRCHDINRNGWYQLIPFYSLWLLYKTGEKDANDYGNVPQASGVNKNNFVFISLYSLFHLGKKLKGQSLLDVSKGKFDPEKVEAIKAVWRVMFVFFFALGFWAVWDQNLSEWVLQAAKMDRTINLGFTHFTILAGQVQTFNPVFLLIFIPIFSYWIYPAFDKMGLKTTPLRKLGVGLILTALSFVIIAIVQGWIDSGQHPSIWWQVFAYVILSAAEVLVSITGLEYAYTHAPKSMKGTMTGIWYMVVAVGNMITALVNGNISNKGILAPYLVGANYYWYFDVGLIVAFIIVFLIVSPRMKEHNYIENPGDNAADHNKIIADTDNL
ncbi:MAG: MFS transporter [Sphingobacteriales bacterium]